MASDPIPVIQRLISIPENRRSFIFVCERSIGEVGDLAAIPARHGDMAAIDRSGRSSVCAPCSTDYQILGDTGLAAFKL